MKILVTGVAGFLGSHVAEYYRKKGDEVFGIDNLTEFELERAKFDVKASRKHNLDFLKEIGVVFKKWDCRDVSADEILHHFGKVDFIIHCAAQPAMTIAIEHPGHDMDNNICGTVNMLEIAKKLRIPMVNCSTIHVYGNNINGSLLPGSTRFECVPEAFDEETQILNGDVTPLHVSKRATELYTQTYAETYKMRTASFRLTGMYGPRQFGGMDHGWVANFAIRTIMKRPITIFDTDKQVRDILYAQDAAKSFDEWYKRGKVGVYNIGGGTECSISINEALALLKKITKEKQDIKFEPARFGDLYYFVCDYQKALKDFGWKPTTMPEEGVKKLVEWIQQNKGIL
jgi:CDP-paratose 2-epimerase